jgi:hypothetical protein
MRFTLKQPCPHCPFRTDIIQPQLTPAHASRVKAMVKTILTDNMTFACHITNAYDENGEAVEDDPVQFCAGAMILLKKLGLPHEVVDQAIAEGKLDTSRLDLSSPVYESLEAVLDDMNRPDYGSTPATREPV